MVKYMDPSMKERDETSGRYTEAVSDDDIVDYVRERGGVTTSDVATEFDYERPSAYRRLKALEDNDRVTARKIGNSLLWEAANTLDAPRDTPRDSSAGAVQDTASNEDQHTAGTGDETEQQAIDIDSVDVPGSGEKADRRRAAVGAALEYIREHGEATPTDLREDVYPDHEAGYTSGGDPARSWWKNAIYPALRAIAERDDRLEKADTTGRWSWRGE